MALISTVGFFRRRDSIEHRDIPVSLVSDIWVYNCVTDISTDYKSHIDVSLLNQFTYMFFLFFSNYFFSPYSLRYESFIDCQDAYLFQKAGQFLSSN